MRPFRPAPLDHREDNRPLIPTDLQAGPSRTVFGHPRGLGVLALTELWDRISFHGMLAVLVLFMADQLRRPGHAEHIVGFRAFSSALFAFRRGFGARFYDATSSATVASVA